MMNYTNAGATLSECGTWRYDLRRAWGVSPLLCVIGLNPSTADAEQDDPTIRRCVGFAQRWGYGRLTMLNLYAYRATSPAVLKSVDYGTRIGPGNITALRDWCIAADVLLAWGAGAAMDPEWAATIQSRVTEIARTVQCLGLTKGGHPRHPLYVRGDTEPIPVSVARAEAARKEITNE